jgi:hemophore-related protein
MPQLIVCGRVGVTPLAEYGRRELLTGADLLDTHPGANQMVTAAYHQPRSDAAANIRGYLTANPQEYYELRAILAPTGDTQRQCNVRVLPPDLASAYDQFMAG